MSVQQFKEYFEALLNCLENQETYSYASPDEKVRLLDEIVSLEELKEVLIKLKDQKAPGEDRIPYEFFKYASDGFLEALAKAFTDILNSGEVDEVFLLTIIFPIYKKGDRDEVGNYRGISFMNCVAKLLMAVLNSRLCKWVQENNKLNEFQAGFRPKYSTVDNIYNLCSIIQLKFLEGKKTYAFFVDFKAAFDRVPRQALLYKLSCMGLSRKFLKLLESLYKGTKSAVWDGEAKSDYFETKSGVKQGCLLSPLLFALYLNDLHDALGGGLLIAKYNVRVLLYADDIVILADNPNILQRMINRLEKYCEEWSLTVNVEKSKIMVFREGGILSSSERWFFKRNPIEIVSSYIYLGVKFTPRMAFTEHIKGREDKAKVCVRSTWSEFLHDKNINIDLKLELFNAVIRAIQVYAGQVFGFAYCDDIDRLQRYFLKSILHLPDFMPTYALYLETNVIPTSVYTMKLHMNYIFKTLFVYGEERLPNFLSKRILEKKIFWFRGWCDREGELMVRWSDVPLEKTRWANCIKSSIENLKTNLRNKKLNQQNETQRIYKKLNPANGSYLMEHLNSFDVMWIIKARCDILGLNVNKFDQNADKRCSLCNTNEVEDVLHFIGRCPVLKEFRLVWLRKYALEEIEVIRLLNGEGLTWSNLSNYIKKSWEYRKLLINEFNY